MPGLMKRGQVVEDLGGQTASLTHGVNLGAGLDGDAHG